MGDSKHTPGPWRAQEEIELGFGIPSPQHHWRIYSDALLKRPSFVCEVPSHSAGPKKADARLIAAAPQLLEALEAFEELICESEGVGGWHLNGDLAPWKTDFPEHIRLLESALAAARGEGDGS